MKVPVTPPDTFTTDGQHLRTFGADAALWRIYRTSGPHPTAWDALRHYGPIAKQRWDPHASPVGMDPDAGVLYASADPTTAFGEVYQDRRVIARAQGAPALVAWQPARDLTLLDLTTNWPVVNGSAASMMMGDKRSTQAWARAIDMRLGDRVDGLYALSSITSRPVITLFSRTEREPAFPLRPQLHALLTDASIDAVIDRAARELGYGVLA